MFWRFRSAVTLSFFWFLVTTPSVMGLDGEAFPVVITVFPPGATAGEVTEWSITGQNLARVRRLMISGQGAEVVDFTIKSENEASASVRMVASAEPGYREIRLDGPTGLSNLALIRVDSLRQILETGPNQTLVQAQPVPVGTAVAGILRRLDQDHYKVQGKPGQRLTIDLEARRVGTSIAPVVTVFGGDGRALVQKRESRRPDRECVFVLDLPDDGVAVIQVRDNLYAGNDHAAYRLRIDPAPLPTAMQPLSGATGQRLEIEAFGGSLDQPLRKSIQLPDQPGNWVDPGAIASPAGTLLVPMRIAVRTGSVLVEPTDRQEGSVIEIGPGQDLDGRIGRPGEVDRYRLKVKSGEKVALKVQAVALGSWLDPVVIIRDSRQAILAENDDSMDAVMPEQADSVNGAGLPRGTIDSSVEFAAWEDGEVVIEVTDRYGDGGAEYSYRLVNDQDRPDLAVTLLLGNPRDQRSKLPALDESRSSRSAPTLFGVFNLTPGSELPIHFRVAPDGRPGPVEVSVEGLPPGVSADPVRIRFPGPRSIVRTRSDPVTDFILLKVSSSAPPGLSELRVVARASPTPGVVIVREASGAILLESSTASTRPILRVLNRIPLRIVGETRP